MRDYLTFDGVNIDRYKCIISNAGFYQPPERRYKTFVVPGRNGSLTMDAGDYNNIEITFPAAVYEEFNKNFPALKSFLYSNVGYRKLQTTFARDEYRKAIFKHIEDVVVSPEGLIGSCKLVFESMPQRWLESGDIPLEFTADGTIYNPTEYPSRPLIRVYGNGTLGIGGTNITLSNNTGYTDIDCEMMDSYYGSTNRNSNVVLSPNEYPTLLPGANGVSLGAGITKVEITPKWWRI